MLGNKIIDRILVLINLLGLAFALGIFIYIEYIYKRPILDNDAEFLRLSNEALKQTFIKPYALDKMILNLHSHQTRLRFLNVEIHLLPFLETQIPLLEKNKALINDSIIRIAGEMEPAEINSLAGKILLEDRIKKEINQILRKPVVKKVYFTSFVVQ